LKNIYDNANKMDFAKTFDISPIFNVVDMYEFHEGAKEDHVGTMVEWK